MDSWCIQDNGWAKAFILSMIYCILILFTNVAAPPWMEVWVPDLEYCQQKIFCGSFLLSLKKKNLAIILMNGKMWVFLPLRAFICLYFLFHFYCSCRVFWGVGLFALAFKASMCLHMHRNTRQSLVVPIGKQILSSVPINAADFFLFFMFMDIFCSWWPIPLPNQSSCSQIFL